MSKRRNMLSVVLLVAILLGIAAIAKNSFAQKASTPRPQDKLALGEDDVRQLLLLVGGDRNGKITKQEWMNFMEAEFDRLDKNKSGELDAQELARSRLRVSPFARVGK
jgi:hypothetical protein